VKITITILKFLLKIAKDLREERKKSVLEDLSGLAIDLKEFLFMMRFHVFICFREALQKNVHPVCVGYMLCHQFMHFFRSLLYSKRVTVLGQA
jgi:hypothetical protein